MQCNTVIDGQSAVALRKESVDRKEAPTTQADKHARRSPQGERG